MEADNDGEGGSECPNCQAQAQRAGWLCEQCLEDEEHYQALCRSLGDDRRPEGCE